MENDMSDRLAANIRQLRGARNLTQQQMARLSGLPRATWANLESGSANPTLAVLSRVAVALQVPIEELISSPRSSTRLYPVAALASSRRGEVMLRHLLPDKVPGMVIDRMEFPVGTRMTGVPHTPGTREYLACESGELLLVASGEQWRLSAGDVLVFRGDQKHSYANPGTRVAVAYSVVMLQPAG